LRNIISFTYTKISICAFFLVFPIFHVINTNKKKERTNSFFPELYYEIYTFILTKKVENIPFTEKRRTLIVLFPNENEILFKCFFSLFKKGKKSNLMKCLLRGSQNIQPAYAHTQLARKIYNISSCKRN
jgi:hypothetical protein